jgi:aconitate hydratase
VQELEAKRQKLVSEGGAHQELKNLFSEVLGEEGMTAEHLDELIKNTGLGSVIFAMKPGDGSAREQAASCQRVLGGDANIAIEYATKRYRSNVVNWGMIPFTIDKEEVEKLVVDDYIYVPGIRQSILEGAEKIQAFVINKKGKTPLNLKLEGLTKGEREIILAGCLINYYAGEQG